MNILVYFLFALSGFAGLIYEGSWARYLKLFLGHASYGQVLTLCIYMGGLAIGSFIAGKMVEWVKRPLLGYAAVELAIGIGGLVYHPLYNAWALRAPRLPRWCWLRVRHSPSPLLWA